MATGEKVDAPLAFMTVRIDEQTKTNAQKAALDLRESLAEFVEQSMRARLESLLKAKRIS